MDASTDETRVGWRFRAVGFVGAWFLRALRASLRVRHHGEATIRAWEKEERRFILAFWHRHILLMPWGYRGSRISVLVSRSRDGEYIVQTVRRLGIEPSRGSSSRAGASGMLSLVRLARAGWDIAFTPDGPRGPAREVKPGVIAGAALTALPIVPVAYAASRERHLASWDRTVLPLPFASIHFVYGQPLTVGRDDDAAAAAMELKRRLDAASEEAARWARGEAA
jgi:lysophospholipid acyltransferase (LPLAT)-like uncharacterized protein